MAEQQPGITKGAIERLDRYLTKYSLVFEWGCGPSTIWLAKRARHVYSVEHDPDRYNWMGMQVGASGLNNVTLLAVDHSTSYAAAILHTKLVFDLIMLPGERAIANPIVCSKLATKKILSRGVIVLDNSASISHHQEAEYLEDWAKFSEDFGASGDWMTSLYHRH